jgi:translation elongation factor EF-Tu-like GTPase
VWKFFGSVLGLIPVIPEAVEHIIQMFKCTTNFSGLHFKKEEGGRAKPFTSYIQLQMFSKTWDVAAQIVIPDKDMIMPGEDSK